MPLRRRITCCIGYRPRFQHHEILVGLIDYPEIDAMLAAVVLLKLRELDNLVL